MRWSEEFESTAHHEAGHWVIAENHGCDPGLITVRWNSEERYWEGDIQGRPDAPQDGNLLTALAAGWAEILYQARKKYGQATAFDLTDPAELLISQEIAELAGSDDNDFDNNIPTVRLVATSGSVNMHIDPNAFSFDTHRAYRIASRNIDKVQSAFLPARDLVCKEDVWSDITQLARELVKRLGQNQPSTMSRAEVLELLKR